MTQQDTQANDKRTAVLNRLRAQFGEDRSGEMGDVDGVGLLSMFLRPLKEEHADPNNSVDDKSLSREELIAMRRRRRMQKEQQSETPGLDEFVNIDEAPLASGAEKPIIDSVPYSALIAEIPQLQENFSEWLASVDAEFLPSSTTLDELQALRRKAEYRSKILTLMLHETQRELDNLIVAIRATEAIRGS